MEWAEQVKTIEKEKNQNRKEIEDLRQKTQTIKIQIGKVYIYIAIHMYIC